MLASSQNRLYLPLSLTNNPPPPLQLTPECIDLLDRILHVDPNQRLRIPEIQAHPWMNQ